MLLFAVVLCFLTNMCFVNCEVKQIWLVIIKCDPSHKCIKITNQKFYAGDTVVMSVENDDIEVLSMTLHIPGYIGYAATSNHSKYLNFTNISVKDSGHWEITVNFSKPQPESSSSCGIAVEVEPGGPQPDSWTLNTTPYFAAIAVQLVIILALLFSLVYLLCRGRKTQKLLRADDIAQTSQADDNKSLFNGVESKPETPQTARYISKPGLNALKITPITDNNRDSDIYEVPDITKCDQDTLRSNKSIALRPPLPIPDEEIYTELPEPPPPTFVPQSTTRPRPKVAGQIPEKQTVPFSSATLKPQQPKITADMLNRFAPAHDATLTPNPLRKKEPKMPAVHTRVQITETKQPPVLTRVPMNDHSSLPRKKVHVPQSQYPIPGPSDLKKNLKPVGQHNTLPSIAHAQAQASKLAQTGPAILKKPPKPLPPLSKPKAPVADPVQHFNDFRQENPSDDSDFDEYEPIYSL